MHGGSLKSTADLTINLIEVSLGIGTINVNNGTTLTYNGIAASNGNLTKSGTGTLVLESQHFYRRYNNWRRNVVFLLADTTNVSVSSGAIYDVVPPLPLILE